MSEPWSDSKKWWMDLLKNAVSFSVAGAVSLFLVDSVQMRRVEAKSRADAFYAARVKALDDLRAAAITYDMSAYIAYGELYRWRSKERTPAMLAYEQEAFSKWALSLESIAYLFPAQEASAKALSNLGIKRYRVYATLVGARLEGNDLTPIAPQASQEKFNEAADEIRAARSDLIAKVQASLFPISPRD